MCGLPELIDYERIELEEGLTRQFCFGCSFFSARGARFTHFKELFLAAPVWVNDRIVNEIQLNVSLRLVLLCLSEGNKGRSQENYLISFENGSNLGWRIKRARS